MPQNQNKPDRLREITASIEEGIKKLFQSDNYAQYLQTMSRFHRYSVNNQMLIYMQKPNATLVAGFNKWKDQFGRNVIKGEHGIKIIAPTPYKKKIEKEKLDPDTKLPMLDENGRVIMEEKTVQIPMYKPVTVFDVSQTEGRPLPQLSKDLSGNVENYELFMEALRRSSPVPISIETMSGKIDGYFDLEHQDIALRKGMSEVQTVCAAIHEIAHALLHNTAKAAEEPKPEWNVLMVSEGGTRQVLSSGYETENDAIIFAENEGWHYLDENQFDWALEVEQAPEPEKNVLSRNTEEVQAESISYAVCAYCGIATGENSFGYIAAWSKDKTLPELRESLEVINKTAGKLIDDIDRHYAEIVQEREAEAIALEPPVEKLPEPVVENPADPAISIEARNAYGYTDDAMLPLTKERAMELFERDVPVYLLYQDSTEAMAFEPEEILQHDGVFGIDRADWEQIKEQEPITQPNKWQEAFRNATADSYCIFQLRDNATELRFMGYDYLERKDLTPSADNYDAVYAGDLSYPGDTTTKLDGLYHTFNMNHPQDFTGHSLSVSDIVALKQDGVVSCHYVDSIGFKAVPDFLKPENYLRSAELSTEDDYGMIDGINPEESVIPKKSGKRIRRDGFCL